MKPRLLQLFNSQHDEIGSLPYCDVDPQTALAVALKLDSPSSSVAAAVAGSSSFANRPPFSTFPYSPARRVLSPSSFSLSHPIVSLFLIPLPREEKEEEKDFHGNFHNLLSRFNNLGGGRGKGDPAPPPLRISGSFVRNFDN